MGEVDRNQLDPLEAMGAAARRGIEALDSGNSGLASREFGILAAIYQLNFAIKAVLERYGTEGLPPGERLSLTIPLEQVERSAIIADELRNLPFSVALGRLRKAAGLTQAELERRAGYANMSLTRRLRDGKWVPQPPTVSKLTKGLGWEPEDWRAQLLMEIAETGRQARVARKR